MRPGSVVAAASAVITVAALLGGCQIIIGVEETSVRDAAGDDDHPDAGPFVAARVAADGVLAEVTVRIVAGAVDETLVVSADGPATFPSQIANHGAYQLELLGAPACVLGPNASGTADGDVEVALVCAGATQLSALTLATRTGEQPALAPGELSYAMTVGELQQSTRVTATARSAAATLVVEGVALANGATSAPIPLAYGGNTITIAVEHPLAPSLRTTYTVAVARQATLAHAFYGKAYPQSIDMLGWAMATDGQRVIVGAPHESSATDPSNTGDASEPSSGAAYVFAQQGGTWVLEGALKAPNAEGTTLGSDGDLFGYAVAISGDRAIVGAPFEDSGGAAMVDNSAFNAGAAYVYRREPSGAWVFEQYLKATLPEPNGFVGWGLAIDGDTAAIGGYNQNDPDLGISDSGLVYVYRRAGNVWSLEATLHADPVTGPGDGFGYAIALQGDRLVASSIAGHPTVGGAGAVRIFDRSGTTWSLDEQIVPNDPVANDFFGASVALDGTTVVVGASVPVTPAGNATSNDPGRAYVFTRNASGWSQRQRLVASNGDDDDELGRSVAIVGDLIAVSALREGGPGSGVIAPSGSNAAAESGATYLYRKIGAAWDEVRYIKGEPSEAGDSCGSAVALGRDFLAIGSPGEDGGTSGGNSVPTSGAFYVLY
jgi:hypothetical protein